jgi:hypothetical protein
VAPSVGSRSGNTTTFATTTGTLTNGHCVSIDASANLVDNGSACGSGGGGSGTVTSVATGTGLTGGTITTTGTIDLANISATSHQWFDSVVSNALHKSQPAFSDLSGSIASSQLPTATIIENVRLYAATGVPVPTGDTSSTTNVYVGPYNGATMTTYDSSVWTQHSFTEQTVALGTLTGGKNYDAFCWNNSGIACLLGPAWSSDTSRGTGAGTTELTLQDGVNVNANSISGACGAKACIYIGTVRTISTTATADTAAKRFIWNWWNRQLAYMANATETTDSWTYSTGAFRQANANTANQLDYVTGDASQVIDALVKSFATGAGSNIASAGIGVDSTSVNSAAFIGLSVNTATAGLSGNALYRGRPGLGRHFLPWLEYGAAGVNTFYGDAGAPGQYQSGISGTMWN